MTTYDHVHAYFRPRLPWLVAVLAFLRLPYGWLIESGDLPHHPECTPDVAVLVQE